MFYNPIVPINITIEPLTSGGMSRYKTISGASNPLSGACARTLFTTQKQKHTFQKQTETQLYNSLKHVLTLHHSISSPLADEKATPENE